jgi:hypothetical protein
MDVLTPNAHPAPDPPAQQKGRPMRRLLLAAGLLAGALIPLGAATASAPTAHAAGNPTCANQAERQNNTLLLGQNATAPLFADVYFHNALQTSKGAVSPHGNAKWVLCWTVQGSYPFVFGTVYLWNYGTQKWVGDNPHYGPHINTATASQPSYSEGFLFVCHGGHGQFNLANLSTISRGDFVEWFESYGNVSVAEVNASGGSPDVFYNETGTGFCFGSD